MSYNVDTWKTKELTDLRIPIASLFKHERKDWHLTRVNHNDGSVTFSDLGCINIHGTLDGDVVVVSSIEASGEGSGRSLAWIIEPAMKHSTGKLIASRVWEGGDYIDRLIVVDGDVTSEEIEL